LVLWGKPTNLNEAVSAYEESLQLAPNDGWTHFRTGVAYRTRYDSGLGEPADFQRAQDQWSQALDIDPNQILWLRRSQQYGPFQRNMHYDWIPQARAEITARGETPVPLVIEPSGVELETLSKDVVSNDAVPAEPDPRGRIYRDQEEFIHAEITAAPRVINSGTATRVHIVLRPIVEKRAFWNNEAGDLVMWVNPPQGWTVNQRYLTLPLPPQPETQETRQLEVELKSPVDAKRGTVDIPAYSLYYVCEDVNGICMFRRQDLTLKVDIR
jgi:hypothetical protein